MVLPDLFKTPLFVWELKIKTCWIEFFYEESVMLVEGPLYTLAVVILITVGQLFRAPSENFQQCRTWVNILLG